MSNVAGQCLLTMLHYNLPLESPIPIIDHYRGRTCLLFKQMISHFNSQIIIVSGDVTHLPVLNTCWHV